jgi:hypothetical protein
MTEIQRPHSCPIEGQIPSFDAGWNAHKLGISRKTVEVLSPPLMPGVKSWGVYAWDIRDQLATEARREYARTPITAEEWGNLPAGATPTFVHPTDQGPPDESYGFTAHKTRWEPCAECARVAPLLKALTGKLGWAMFNLGKGKHIGARNLIIGAERILDEIRGTDYAYIWEHGHPREDNE